MVSSKLNMITDGICFDVDKQRAFGYLSHDTNPMHMDALYARRLLFGGPVVHGMHTFMAVVDAWLAQVQQPVRFINASATFRNPIRVGKIATITSFEEKEGEVRVQVAVGPRTVAQCTWSYAPAGRTGTGWPLTRSLPLPQECRVIAEEDLAGMAGELQLCYDSEAADRLFPHLVKWLPHYQAAILLAISRLVGMECPGLHSLFGSFDLEFQGEDNLGSRLFYAVREFDSRISRLQIAVKSEVVSGIVTAFRRPAPRNQPACSELIREVTPEAFNGQRALIVGGSRGLGELTAKLLAIGGAQVCITYHQGEDDALRVSREITQEGGQCYLMQWDVRSPPMDLPAFLSQPPTHVYYFATPFAFEAIRGRFSIDLFDAFCAYYVHGFLTTVDRVTPPKGKLQTVFYPSSVAVDDPPANMGEYAAAKAAGEIACRFLDKTRKNLRVRFYRLPRLATDQTASMLSVNEEDSVSLIRSILSDLQDL